MLSFSAKSPFRLEFQIPNSRFQIQNLSIESRALDFRFRVKSNLYEKSRLGKIFLNLETGKRGVRKVFTKTKIII